jgi:hypothetical protein
VPPYLRQKPVYPYPQSAVSEAKKKKEFRSRCIKETVSIKHRNLREDVIGSEVGKKKVQLVVKQRLSISVTEPSIENLFHVISTLERSAGYFWVSL